MKLISSISFVLVTIIGGLALASGSSVGPRPTMEIRQNDFNMPNGSREIVLHLKDAQGRINFAHGNLVNGQWEIENHSIPRSDLQLDKAAIEALDLSKVKKTWIYIQGNN